MTKKNEEQMQHYKVKQNNMIFPQLKKPFKDIPNQE